MTRCTRCDEHTSRPGQPDGLCTPCEVAGGYGYAIPIGGGWAVACPTCAEETMLDDDETVETWATVVLLDAPPFPDVPCEGCGRVYTGATNVFRGWEP